MIDTEAIEQKIKGKLQKVKGEVEQKTSHDDDLGMKIKGGISKIKGTVNEKAADLKMDIDRKKKDVADRYNDDYDSDEDTP
jgi:hypothetical protein